jgi:hypothetical protein
MPPPETAMPRVMWVEKKKRSRVLVEVLFQIGQQWFAVFFGP